MTAQAIVQEIVYGVKDAMVEAHRALVLAESLEKPEAMISAIRLKSDLQRLIMKQAEHGGAGAFSLPTDPNERKELLERIRAERAARKEPVLQVVKKAG